ncbi:unnamed protein product [Coffea canephora]|uniref:Peptidase S8/S53 domain-containing protein n=1 Tax=Coffea canephora TaxID=49390 RepID=A0A068V875_COFCA|nr:unnamed protein product [Coffea canephora]
MSLTIYVLSLQFRITFNWLLFTDHARATLLERSIYIIHIDNSLMPKAFATHHYWYLTTVDSLQSASPSTNMLYTYNHVLQGFSALFSNDELDHLKKSPGFVLAYKDKNPIAIASFVAIEKGVFVATSAGNNGLESATLHNDIPWALTVAARTVDRSFVGTLTLVALYSSRGPSKNCPGILKPNIMAPGSLVLAASIPSQTTAMTGSGTTLSSEYIMMSGTSMACPHIVGVAALLKCAHPEWSPAAIRSAMMTIANPLDNTNNPIKDKGQKLKMASPLDIGAGQIDPNRALDLGLIYDDTTEAYPSLDLNYPTFVALYNNRSKSMIQNFKWTVTNVGDGAVTYKSKVTTPKNCAVKVSPDTFVFERMLERQNFSLTMHYIGRNSGIWLASLGGLY